MLTEAQRDELNAWYDDMFWQHEAWFVNYRNILAKRYDKAKHRKRRERQFEMVDKLCQWKHVNRSRIARIYKEREQWLIKINLTA